MQLAAFLCVISAICGRITRKSTLSIHTNETPISPADLADDADKTQNNKTQNETNSKTIQTSTCLSLRNNTACCIPLRDQRHLRENKYARVLHQSTKEPPISLADPADLRRQTPKPKATITTITTITTLTTTCLSLRNNAACCIPLRDLRNLRENNA